MFLVLESADSTMIETLIPAIPAIPESLGVLIFGVVLVVTPLLIRRILSRNETQERDEKTAK